MKQPIESLMPWVIDPNRFSHKFIFGYNGDVDNTWEDLVSTGSTVNLLATTGQHIHGDSDSAEDDPDKGAGVPGTGIHTLRITYLDTDYAEQTEDLDLNGTAATQSTATDVIAINRVVAETVGTGGGAAGSIIVKNAAESATLATLAAGETVAHHAVYTVPASKALRITSFGGRCAKNDGTAVALCDLRIIANCLDKTKTSVYITHAQDSIYASGAHYLDEALYFPAQTVVRLQAKGIDAGSYLVNGWMEGFLVTV